MGYDSYVLLSIGDGRSLSAVEFQTLRQAYLEQNDFPRLGEIMHGSLVGVNDWLRAKLLGLAVVLPERVLFLWLVSWDLTCIERVAVRGDVIISETQIVRENEVGEKYGINLIAPYSPGNVEIPLDLSPWLDDNFGKYYGRHPGVVDL